MKNVQWQSQALGEIAGLTFFQNNLAHIFIAERLASPAGYRVTVNFERGKILD